MGLPSAAPAAAAASQTMPSSCAPPTPRSASSASASPAAASPTSSSASPSPHYTLIISTPAGELESCLPPSRPSSPSHSHSPSVPASTRLERYWPFIAVTICSLYLITLMPFIAPGLFLVQFSLLRYIQQHKKDRSRREQRQWGRSSWLRSDDGSLRSRRDSRLKQPPIMDVIPEETKDEVEQEAATTAASDSVVCPPQPAQPRRPPPLTIPDCQLGVITAPWPADERASRSPPPTVSVPSFSSSSSAWSHDLNESLQSLLHSSLLSPPSSASASSSNFLAATAAFFSPSIFQSLTAPSPPAASSSPAQPSTAASSVPSTPHGVQSVQRAFSFSQHCERSPSRPSSTEQLSLEEDLEMGAAPQRLQSLDDEKLQQQAVLCM